MGPESHRAQVHVHIEDSLATAVDRMAEGWRVGSLSLSAPLCLSVSVCVLSLCAHLSVSVSPSPSPRTLALAPGLQK